MRISDFTKRIHSAKDITGIAISAHSAPVDIVFFLVADLITGIAIDVMITGECLYIPAKLWCQVPYGDK